MKDTAPRPPLLRPAPQQARRPQPYGIFAWRERDGEAEMEWTGLF